LKNKTAVNPFSKVFCWRSTVSTAGAFLLSLLLPLAVVAEDSAQDWLERMQQAVEGINYEGTLVHMTPGHAEQFRVYHRVVEQRTTERVVFVDGAGAEIIRTPEEVICIFPQRKSVVIESRNSSSPEEGQLRNSLPSFADLMPEYYELSVTAEGRVAERPAKIISITPRDTYRYGYRLWLDQATAMPLKSQLIGDDVEMPLEEIRFISILLPDEVSEDAVMSSIDISEFNVSRNSKAAVYETAGDGLVVWRAEQLPAGFMLTVSRYEYTDSANQPRVHMVYTDGLASVSVFIDMAVAASEQAEGLSMMGAANAYSVMRDGHLITAMGEVPPTTVKQIALSTVTSNR
jgi:sigma-E factor negative regulatory protein RseB